MNSENSIATLMVFLLTALAAYLSHKVYKKVKSVGVEDDMAFRLIWLIGSFAALYFASLSREAIEKYSTPEFIQQGSAGVIIITGLYTLFIFFITVKTKLQELGTTKIWKKILYSAVISTVAAWAGTLMGVTEAITIAKIVIGGAFVFSLQLLG